MKYTSSYGIVLGPRRFSMREPPARVLKRHFAERARNWRPCGHKHWLAIVCHGITGGILFYLFFFFFSAHSVCFSTGPWRKAIAPRTPTLTKKKKKTTEKQMVFKLPHTHKHWVVPVTNQLRCHSESRYPVNSMSRSKRRVILLYCGYIWPWQIGDWVKTSVLHLSRVRTYW